MKVQVAVGSFWEASSAVGRERLLNTEKGNLIGGIVAKVEP